MDALIFTWLRVNGEPGEQPITPGLYVDALEVAAYLREHGAEHVAEALEDLAASQPPPTVTGSVMM